MTLTGDQGQPRTGPARRKLLLKRRLSKPRPIRWAGFIPGGAEGENRTGAVRAQQVGREAGAGLAAQQPPEAGPVSTRPPAAVPVASELAWHIVGAPICCINERTEGRSWKGQMKKKHF